jgi:hypothetical protein
METPTRTRFTHTNPYEELSIIHLKTKTELEQLKLEVSNKNKLICKLKSETEGATKYIERMELKYVNSADTCVTIKAENLSLKKKLKHYEDKFGK